MDESENNCAVNQVNKCSLAYCSNMIVFPSTISPRAIMPRVIEGEFEDFDVFAFRFDAATGFHLRAGFILGHEKCSFSVTDPGLM